MEDLGGFKDHEMPIEVSVQVKEVSGVWGFFSIFGVWTEGTPAEVEEWTRKQEKMPI